MRRAGRRSLHPLCLFLIAALLPAAALAKRKQSRRCGFPVYPPRAKLQLDKSGRGRVPLPKRKQLLAALAQARMSLSQKAKTPPALTRALAAFARAKKQIVSRARRAGWTLARTDMMLDGGSPTWTFLKPSGRQLCTVFVTLNSHGGMTSVSLDGRIGVPNDWATLDYSVARRPAPLLVAGFPLCLGLDQEVVTRRRTKAGLELSARCPHRPEVWVGALPETFGWKRVKSSTSWRKGKHIVRVQRGSGGRRRWLFRRR